MMRGLISGQEGPRHSAILGLGHYRASRTVDNAEIGERIGLPGDTIYRLSGIRSRRWSTSSETVASMGEAAAREALEHAGVPAATVDCVIVATISHLRQTPAIATTIAAQLGATNAGAFDLSAACAGFCYGLALASDMVRAGGSRHVLVIAVERISDLIHMDAPSTAMLFADGAGAALVGPSSDAGIGPVVWGADGTRADLIEQAEPWDRLKDDPGADWPGRLHMSGTQVFRWAVTELAPVGRRAAELAGVRMDQLAAVIPHQSNGRIIAALAKSLNLPPGVRVALDIEQQGNTVGASIPLAMVAMLRDGQASPGDLALLLGYGAGLVHAAQVVRLPPWPEVSRCSATAQEASPMSATNTADNASQAKA